MKGDRKKAKNLKGCRAILLSRKCLTTEKEKEENDINSKLTPSTPKSIRVSPSPSHDVHPSPSDVSPGNSLWLPRLREDEFKLYAKKSFDGKFYTSPSVSNAVNNVKLLRPIKQNDQELDRYLQDEKVENRVVDRELTLSMINDLIASHLNCSPTCTTPYFQLSEEKQWGLGWQWILRCDKCTFVSDRYKLFKEIDNGKPGRKAGAVNYGFETGVMNSTIGNDSARFILTSAGIPPISKSGMQRITNRVSDKIVDLVEDETATMVKNLQERNKTLGLPKTNPINMQMDTVYSTMNIKSRHKMGQNASQAIGVACENETDDHNIVSYHLLNKLCWVGAWLRGKGYDVECPDHEQCTANANQYEPISERNLGYEIGIKIGKQDLLVDYCTTDGDSTSVSGLQDAMLELFNPLWSVKRQADTVHRGQSQFRQGLKAQFSDGMFPGLTKAEKGVKQIAFANDIKIRSHKIMKCLFAEYNGDLKKISAQLPRVLKSVVKCYSGNCGDTCRWSTTLCKGGKKTSWWFKSVDLNSNGLHNGSLNPNEHDIKLLTELLEMKISQSALDQMQFFGNTNKCERVNKVINTCLPKNRTFCRNAKGRVAAAVLKVNAKPHVALAKSLQAVGCPLGKKSLVVKELKNMRKRQLYDRAYQMRSHTSIKKVTS